MVLTIFPGLEKFLSILTSKKDLIRISVGRELRLRRELFRFKFSFDSRTRRLRQGPVSSPKPESLLRPRPGRNLHTKCRGGVLHGVPQCIRLCTHRHVHALYVWCVLKDIMLTCLSSIRYACLNSYRVPRNDIVLSW